MALVSALDLAPVLALDTKLISDKIEIKIIGNKIRF
jgi:hypothetical protein